MSKEAINKSHEKAKKNNIEFEHQDEALAQYCEMQKCLINQGYEVSGKATPKIHKYEVSAEIDTLKYPRIPDSLIYTNRKVITQTYWDAKTLKIRYGRTLKFIYVYKDQK